MVVVGSDSVQLSPVPDVGLLEAVASTIELLLVGQAKTTPEVPLPAVTVSITVTTLVV